MRQLFSLVTIILAGVAAAEDYYQPTDTPLPFNFLSDASFSTYIEVTASYLMAHREFIRPNRKAAELELVMPFELAHDPDCKPPLKGVLLVHGILETPYAMRDIGKELSARCFRVAGAGYRGRPVVRAGTGRDVSAARAPIVLAQASERLAGQKPGTAAGALPIDVDQCRGTGR